MRDHEVPYLAQHVQPARSFFTGCGAAHFRKCAPRAATICSAIKTIANATTVISPRCSIRRFGRAIEAREQKLRDAMSRDPKWKVTRCGLRSDQKSAGGTGQDPAASTIIFERSAPNAGGLSRPARASTARCSNMRGLLARGRSRTPETKRRTLPGIPRQQSQNHSSWISFRPNRSTKIRAVYA